MYSAPAGLCGLDHVDLLLVRFRIVAGDDEHALGAGQRLLQAGAVVELRHRGLGVGAEHLS